MKRLALLLLLGMAQPAAAQEACPPPPTVFPFAPPTGPLRFTIETERPVSKGGTGRFGLEYRVQFHSVGRGHGMTATLLRIDAPEAMAAGSAMAAIFAPLVGRPLEFVYDANAGKLLMSKDEADALWKLLADEMLARAANAKPSEARDVSAMLLDLPVGQREAMLRSDLNEMLRFVGRQPGRDVLVTRGNLDGDCNLVRLAEHTAISHPSPGYYVNYDWLVDADTGLVVEQREEFTHVQSHPKSPLLAARTSRRLTPE